MREHRRGGWPRGADQVVAMIWVPILLGTFKLAVFGTGMFFAIKWHYDQGKKKKEEDARAAAEAALEETE
ncbi:hypothetical protein GCM10009075_14640 [Sphingomonas trueperi]